MKTFAGYARLTEERLRELESCRGEELYIDELWFIAAAFEMRASELLKRAVEDRIEP